MSFICHTRWLVVASCLFASACTERTIVREMPAASTDVFSESETIDDSTTGVTIEPIIGTNPEVSLTPEETIVVITATPDTVDGTSSPEVQTTTDIAQTNVDDADTLTSGNLDTENVLQKAETETPTGNSDQIPLEITTSTAVPELPASQVNSQSNTDTSRLDSENSLQSDPSGASNAVDSVDVSTPMPNETPQSGSVDQIIVGAPGQSVDCQQTLPCKWVSQDTHFTVTVTNADNIGKQGRLTIEYTVLMSHDSQIGIASTESAIDDMGAAYEPSALTLGERIGGALQGVLAGTTIHGSIEFDRASSSESVASWSIGISDTGLARQPQFAGIPIGSATDQQSDCENTLPCTWVSPDGDVTITLVMANGFGSTNRLSTNFKIETTRNTVVAIDKGATAVGIDGLRYEGRTHAIGIETSAEKITANSIAGAHVAGTVFFSRTQTMSPMLQHLSLKVYEDQPVPRWNPAFISVPVQ